MAKKSAALNIIFGADTKELDKALGDLGKRLRATADGLTSIGKTMSIGLTAPIGAFAAMSGKTFVDFEFQMQKVKAVSGATAAEFARLQKQAEDLGASTVFSASDVAMLQQEFAKLGFTAAEIDKVTEATLYLAQATDSDLARAAEVAGSTLRGFGLDASQTAMVTDVMAQSFNATSLDLDSFAEAMKYVAPVAAAAGLSLEETTAMLGALANSGIKGSQAGTSLRKIIGDLGKEGGSVTERIDQLAASGLNLAGAQDEVGRQAQTALLVLSNSKPKLDELTTSFKDSGGAAKAMADIMNDSTMGSIKAMESAVEGMQIKIGAARSGHHQGHRNNQRHGHRVHQHERHHAEGGGGGGFACGGRRAAVAHYGSAHWRIHHHPRRHRAQGSGSCGGSGGGKHGNRGASQA